MKSDYVKTLLHAYEHLPKITRRIDEIVLKKALSSMTNYSFCEKQCEKIVNLTVQKALMIETKYFLDRAMSRLTREEKEMLDYKYFRRYHKYNLSAKDFTCRNYFRKQQKLIKTIGDNLTWLNKGNEWFEKRCMRIPFIRKVYHAVKTHDEAFLLSGMVRQNSLQKVA